MTYAPTSHPTHHALYLQAPQNSTLSHALQRQSTPTLLLLCQFKVTAAKLLCSLSILFEAHYHHFRNSFNFKISSKFLLEFKCRANNQARTPISNFTKVGWPVLTGLS
ncbi:uncharacterized protein LOC130987396 [Salvia miltiorrhiza]|uniref:uncharacterized protein LOC130987396 n=1 Tax=Salvia miltiorrhiza TaxID=226208 RepID=UPI0025AD2470|nr:uncharacterized protein LOC130987396 [Salvia miltiorrhiza]